jgi:hypothetical protein
MTTQNKKLHRNISTDLKLIARKTALWTTEYCHNLLHDIKKFYLFGYVESVNIILVDQSGRHIKVKKFVITNNTRSEDHKPGTIDWDEGDGSNLVTILGNTASYNVLTLDQLNSFYSDLRLPWSHTSVDLNFTHLTQSLQKKYSDGDHAVDRIDYN